MKRLNYAILLLLLFIVTTAFSEKKSDNLQRIPLGVHDMQYNTVSNISFPVSNWVDITQALEYGPEIQVINIYLQQDFGLEQKKYTNHQVKIEFIVLWDMIPIEVKVI